MVTSTNYYYLEGDSRLYHNEALLKDQQDAYTALEKIKKSIQLPGKCLVPSAHSSDLFLNLLLIHHISHYPYGGYGYGSGCSGGSGEDGKVVLIGAIFALFAASIVSLCVALYKTVSTLEASENHSELQKGAADQSIHPDIKLLYEKAEPLARKKLVHEAIGTSFVYSLTLGLSALTVACVIALLIANNRPQNFSPTPLAIAGGATVGASFVGIVINSLAQEQIENSKSHEQQSNAVVEQLRKLASLHLLNAPHNVLQDQGIEYSYCRFPDGQRKLYKTGNQYSSKVVMPHTEVHIPKKAL